MSINIVDFEVKDIRFPTSKELHGSDAMNKDPDYSAAYVIFKTDQNGLEGHGLTFTIGRGNDLCVAAIKIIADAVVGDSLDAITNNFGAYWKQLTGDSQLRWLGPDKGVVHLAVAAVVNALWDLYAKAEGKPLWKLIADMKPEELVRCVDFSYIADAITPDEALEMLKKQAPSKQQRIERLRQKGYPAYTTSAGWLGYSDDKIRALCRQAVKDGWTHVKMKVGADLEDDMRRAEIIREEIGYERVLMMDANQKWEVDEAISNLKELARFKPWWIEEPTSPDDILGHAAIGREIEPIRIATGEHCHNRIMFKQFIEADALDICQIDSCRVGGVNENLAIMLMAAKNEIPVCPHAGGVGLCEYVQHLSMIDYIAISGSMENRVIEYVDHLHEHFLDPVTIKKAHYMPPQKPGFSIEMKPDSLRDYAYPDGEVWQELS
ncbi:L-fuconate dehydratase [Aliifodinibius sp. S!AR15-10]|uniref:L-fuconate dehydratase n=1 Tax=Aliifodinibius sp. S!AR15-10 TaxID=2950437 RepID=UPI002857FAA4|nr:L-fuconate dehydratase [Aliifodinibius sp. S!AR15-10]MDR8392718.1 L-fuconate dehydratase [Aliifodinibius sp. S!AR15-10]